MGQISSLEYIYEICIIRDKFTVLDNSIKEDAVSHENSKSYSLSFAPPATAIPELARIETFFERILVRLDGITFHVLCFTSNANNILDPDLNKDLLLELGQECARYTGTASGVKMPLNLEIFYIYEEQVPEEIKNKLRSLKLRTANQGVTAIPWAWNRLNGALWSPQGKILHWLNGIPWRKISRENTIDVNKERKEIENAGFNYKSFVFGVVSAVLLAAVLRLGLAYLGFDDGKLYALTDFLAGITGIVVSVFGAKLRVSSIKQGLITSLSFSTVLYTTLMLLGAAVNAPAFIGILWNSAVLAGIAYMIGKLS